MRRSQRLWGVRLALRWRALGGLIGAMLLVSCATQAPPPSAEIRKQALLEIDTSRPWQAAAGGPGTQLQDNWLNTFQDSTLDALVAEGMRKNPDLRVTAARVEQAGQSLVIAESAMRPAIGISGTGGARAGSGGDASSALQALVLGASWELDVWGRVRYQRNAARESYRSAQADFEFARQSLAASIAKAWFTATQLSIQARATAEMLDAARQLETLAVDRQRVGVSMESDTALARAATKEAASALEQVELARGQALRALEILVGRYPAAEIDAHELLPALPGPVPLGVPLQMLERRPDVIAAERRIAAAFNRVGEAKAARLPQLILTLSVGAFESEILELKEDFENPAAGLGGRLLAPLYQGGALTAQVKIRTLEQQEAIAEYARIALRALADVENTVALNATLSTRAELLTAALGEQNRALEFMRTRFRVGRTDRRALEQQRISVSNARIALLDVQAEQLAAYVNLHLVLGGSFEPQQQRSEAR